MAETIHCWRCGETLENLILPLSRREECAECGAEQHVCRLCKHYNPGLTYGCNEDRAEDVSDKEKANFCDYFAVNPNAFLSKSLNSKARAEAELADLFADSPKPEQPGDSDTSSSSKDKALSELEKLLGKS